jgi:hypothetical protein
VEDEVLDLECVLSNLVMVGIDLVLGSFVALSVEVTGVVDDDNDEGRYG